MPRVFVLDLFLDLGELHAVADVMVEVTELQLIRLDVGRPLCIADKVKDQIYHSMELMQSNLVYFFLFFFDVFKLLVEIFWVEDFETDDTYDLGLFTYSVFDLVKFEVVPLIILEDFV